MEKFKRAYEINSSQCDKNGQLRLRTLFNFFQDLADFHADEMGLGFHFCTMRGIGWIGGAYHVRINRLPVWEDKIVLSTWPSDTTAVTGIRDFQMTDENGNVLINASSQWVLVDTQKMRPVSVVKNVGTYELMRDRALETSFPSLPVMEHVDTEVSVSIRRDDIDINNHVNNAVYPSIVMDSLSDEFLQAHVLAELEVNFKHPAKWGDSFQIKTQIDELTTIHQILNADGLVEFARVRLEWNIKTA